MFSLSRKMPTHFCFCRSCLTLLARYTADERVRFRVRSFSSPSVPAVTSKSTVGTEFIGNLILRSPGHRKTQKIREDIN